MDTSRWTPPIEPTPAEGRVLKRVATRRKLFGFLREHRHELFSEAFQSELDAMYRGTGCGQAEGGKGGRMLASSRRATGDVFPRFLFAALGFCVAPAGCGGCEDGCVAEVSWVGTPATHPLTEGQYTVTATFDDGDVFVADCDVGASPEELSCPVRERHEGLPVVFGIFLADGDEGGTTAAFHVTLLGVERPGPERLRVQVRRDEELLFEESVALEYVDEACPCISRASPVASW